MQVVIIGGEPYFVAVDACRILGLSNPTMAMRALEDDEHLTSVVLRAGQQRPVNVVNESGLYALIFLSRKPGAKKFRKWITSEVLPSIRKTGAYINEQVVEKLSSQASSVTGADDNLYLHSILKAFREFLAEEKQGNICTELRLTKKIEAARTLFPEEKKRLAVIKGFGRFEL